VACPNRIFSCFALKSTLLRTAAPPNPRISLQFSSMTASHAASQRSRAVFPGRKADFAKVAICAELPLVVIASNGRFQSIMLKNSVIGSSCEHFSPHKTSSCIWRRGRPKPIFGLAAPPHVLGAVLQPDFRAPLEAGEKSTFSQTGVFQQNKSF